ncbi:MAG: hypothetical protein NC408_03585 [Candidatus Gastranaerophilales bacterium]|nr:hypothetical protein [Candidatus Gastranaerophilales bacterium]
MKDVLKILDEAYSHAYVLREYCKAHAHVEEIYCMTSLVNIIFENLDKAYSKIDNKKD